jgi:uncharacterized membrane protein YoaK (UPF0700 family)
MTEPPSPSAGETTRLAALLAIAGGFLDAFTYVAHGGVFANAQTGNIVLLGVSLAGWHWLAAIRHMLPILAFVAGVSVAEAVGDPPVGRRLPRAHCSALILELAVLLVVGALPKTFSSTLVILAIAFVAAIQSTTFAKLGAWSLNTTMTTGNLRTAAASGYRAIVRLDAKASSEAVIFGTVCLAFLVGAGVGALLTRSLHNEAAWAACVPLVASLALLRPDQNRSKKAARSVESISLACRRQRSKRETRPPEGLS